MQPVQPVAAAMAIEDYLLRRRGDPMPWLGGDRIVHELDDGSAVLRPTVFQADSQEAEQTRIELPFPCLWVAPWSREGGLRALRDTLALTVFTHDRELIGRLIDDPAIGNVYTGDHATARSGEGTPHAGYLSEFLMRTKSVVRN